MDFITRLDLYAIGRDYVRSRAKKIDPTLVDVDGTDINIFVGSSSVVAAALIKQLAYSVSRLFLDSADGEDLDRWAWDRYRLVRKGASSAIGKVTFERTSFAAGAGSIPAGTKLRTINGIAYVTTTTATFGATSLSATAYVRAIQAGKASQVGKNYIRKFQEASSLFDRSITVNNYNATAGGEDVEEDEDFRERIRDFWRTARRGTLGAIEFGARTVEGVVSALAVEAFSGDGSSARIVNLYIADSSGVANEALARQVVAALDEYRAAGIKVIVYTSIPLIVDIILSLTFRANVDTENLTELIRKAVVEYVNSLPVNGKLTVGGLFAVLQRYESDGLILGKDNVVAPVGDLVPDAGQTIRTTMTNVVVE